MKRVCVYCASSPTVGQVYFEAARDLGKILTELDLEIVFGGGAKGLMGALADSVIENNGKITGIMPHFMKKIEWEHKKVKDYIFVNSMHERKEKLLSSSDAVIALPGGCGTLEELLEAITMKRLGFYKNPIIIINTNRFYDEFKIFLNKSIDEGFMSEKHRKIWKFIDSPLELKDALEDSEDWSDYHISMAEVK